MPQIICNTFNGYDFLTFRFNFYFSYFSFKYEYPLGRYSLGVWSASR